MDALVSLVANVPDWIKRLDELSGQIDQRQLELARLVEPTPSSPSSRSTPARTKSVRNKGSTESLKPRDEGAAWQQEELEAEEDKNSKKKLAESKADNNNTAKAQPAGGATPPSPTAAALQNQTSQAVTAAQARARATLRKRSKRNNDSVMSVEGAAPKYRTRSLIIVYYDSYVQSFFEELVRFVSAQRNLMRKAKMAAKVAQIKRMAELEMGGSMDNEDDGDDGKEAIAVDSGVSPGHSLEVDPTAPITPSTSAAAKPGGGGGGGDGDAIIAASPGPTDGAVPALDNSRTSDMRSPGMLSLGRPMYMRASGRTAYMRGGGGGQGSAYLAGRQQQQQQQADVYDELDKGLEYVQAMCEHAAHQFLRDGDCNEEIENVKRRLTETKEQAHREMQRAKKNDPGDAPGTADAPIKSRSFRQQTMRKEVPSVTVSGSKGGGISAADALAVAREAHMALEVDEGVEDMDDDDNNDDPPKLLYRSTRPR
ncbi:hypothetical protein SPI_08715 [Niveomyces insectorum RCEF 264]|uniref:Uncharacterized protein n=1 Tax=Niveomyces insectorum RCEF 264 TaxID=1081102 RepID=A0A167MWP4_9HYPO|nr:hypothetical protein SPI_08715 [Niveomyces insectorum RCEF 264]